MQIRWNIIKNIVAVYPAGSKIFVFKANRRRRKWKTVSFYTVSREDSDSWVDSVIKVVSNISSPKRTGLLVVLPRLDYFFTRGLYPRHLEGNIEQVLLYEQSEHIFFKEGCSTLIGDVITVSSSLIATLYWLKNSAWEGLVQGEAVKSFEDLLLIPDIEILSRGISSLYSSQIPAESHDKKSVWTIFPSERGHIHALHINYEGSVTESVLIDPSKSFLIKMLEKKIRGNSTVLCSDLVDGDLLKKIGIENGITVSLEEVIHAGILSLMELPVIRGFNKVARINLPKVPLWGYILLAIFFCYSLFVGYVLFEDKRLNAKLAQIRKEKVTLEKQWKPLEEQMKALEEMERDKSALESITAQTIPMREFMEVLSITTPKDTWINNLILTQGNKVILRGDSRSAVQYMGELSKIPGFKDVKFISPVRKDAGSDKEFFNIEITVDWNEFKKARER